MVGNRRVDGALGDGVALEVAVLGVAPGALGAAEAAGAGGVLVDALLAVGEERDHQVALAAVVDQRAQLGVIVGGVAHLGPEHVEVLVVDDLHHPLPRREVLHPDPADQDVAVEVDGVVAVQRQFQLAAV